MATKQTTPPMPPFAPPTWSGNPADALEYLRTYAEQTIENEHSWYVRNKRSRSITSQRIRLLAVVLSVLGGLVPLVVALFGEEPEWITNSPFADIRFGQLGYLLLAIAAGLVLLDRYFGYSTGWMRYIVAMLAIEKSREAFRLDWVSLSRKLSIATPSTPEQAEAIERMVQRARAVILDVKEHSEKETQAWIQEFQTNLAQFEKDLKAQMESNRPGGIDVEIIDGHQADTPIEVFLDGMLADRITGHSGGIGFVAPGLHRVSVRTHKGAQDYSASAMVNVAPAQICRVQLTLKLPATQP
jgi:hypothetical protein